MYALDAFRGAPHVTVEWSARLEGKWRAGDEAVLLESAPAFVSASGAQASAAARKIASALELRGFAPGEAADEALLALGEQPRLRALHLWYSGLGDRGLAALPRYATLEQVNAGNNKAVTDAGALSLAKLTELRRLELAQTSVGDEGLAAIAKLPALETLVLNSTKVTDDGLSALRKHPRLREIRIGWTAITNAGLKHLATIPNLQTVESWDTKNAASKKPLARAELQAL